MRIEILGLAVGLSLVPGGCMPQQASTTLRPVAAVQSAPFSPQNALSRVNAYRQSQGSPPVRLDPNLMQAAASHSRNMQSASTMSHDVGGSFASRISSFGVGRTAAVENIAAGQRSLDEVMESWRRSSGHAANLSNGSMTRMGIAVSGGYWTLIMAGD